MRSRLDVLSLVRHHGPPYEAIGLRMVAIAIFLGLFQWMQVHQNDSLGEV